MTAVILAALMNAGACLAAMTGEVTQGALITAQAAPGSQVMVDGKPVKSTSDGVFVFGLSREAEGSVNITITGESGTCTDSFQIAQRDFDIERVNGLPPKTVTPPPEWTARRKVETGRVRRARAETTDDQFWRGGFIRPAEGRFSGFYGSQRILNGQPRSPHYGLDIAGPTGTPIVAPAGGVVRLAAPDFLLEGGIVIIDHGFGVTSTLFHMNSVTVEEGQTINQGDPIGTIGATGRANGPHVDWRINWGAVRLDPLLALEGD